MSHHIVSRGMAMTKETVNTRIKANEPIPSPNYRDNCALVRSTQGNPNALVKLHHNVISLHRRA